MFVVITDYSMPGMDGATLLHGVSTRWPDITRILLTGNADTPPAARAVNPPIGNQWLHEAVA